MKTRFLAIAFTLAGVTLAAAVALFFVGEEASSAPGDTTADRVFGQGGSFTSNTCNNGGLSTSSLCGPQDGVVDASGNLYIVDSGNHRVLEYDSPLTTDMVADRVFTGLNAPFGVALDTSGNLYVADFGNSRVLEYNTPLTTDTTADRVFGQPDFTSNLCNQGPTPSASTLCSPTGVAVDASGNVYIADFSNNRVLEYNTPLTTDTVADRVFGQAGSFTTNLCNAVSASSLCSPLRSAPDASGNLFVTDSLNHRLLEYNTPLTTDTVADRVFGQGGSFTTGTCNNGGVTASSLCRPSGVTVDASGNLFVADSTSFANQVFGNSRVLEYDTPFTTDTVADRVFGQPNFTSSSCNQGATPSASTLCGPNGVALDGSGNLFVADGNNHRVLVYDAPLAATPTPTASPTATATVSPTATATTSPTPTATPAPNNGSGFAWGENAGWLKAAPANCGNCGVQVSNTRLTGYIWGENIGWINLSCQNNNTCAGSGGNWGVTNNGSGALSGYAWAENAGWISFSCQNNPSTCAGTGNYGVGISGSTGIFSGYAWGENIGWISFSDTSPVAYQVQTSDADADGVFAGSDNCPNWPNPAQNLPPWTVPPSDPDCDGFSTAVETSVGTSATSHCGANGWPADINNDGFSDISDVSALTGVFGSAVPPAPARYNIAPDPPDGFVDITDISKMTGLFGSGCGP